jgi:hypothetical protein
VGDTGPAGGFNDPADPATGIISTHAAIRNPRTELVHFMTNNLRFHDMLFTQVLLR